jgi:hypothetical protein
MRTEHCSGAWSTSSKTEKFPSGSPCRNFSYKLAYYSGPPGSGSFPITSLTSVIARLGTSRVAHLRAHSAGNASGSAQAPVDSLPCEYLLARRMRTMPRAFLAKFCRDVVAVARRPASTARPDRQRLRDLRGLPLSLIERRRCRRRLPRGCDSGRAHRVAGVEEADPLPRAGKRYPVGRPATWDVASTQNDLPAGQEARRQRVPAAVTFRVLTFSKQGPFEWRTHPVGDRDLSGAYPSNAALGTDHDDPAFGYRFIDDELEARGFVASENRVQRPCSLARTWSTHSKVRGHNRVPPHDSGLVSGPINTTSQIGGALDLANMATAAASAAAHHGSGRQAIDGALTSGYRGAVPMAIGGESPHLGPRRTAPEKRQRQHLRRVTETRCTVVCHVRRTIRRVSIGEDGRGHPQASIGHPSGAVANS